MIVTASRNEVAQKICSRENEKDIQQRNSRSRIECRDLLDSELGVVVSRNCSLVLLYEQCKFWRTLDLFCGGEPIMKTLGMMSKGSISAFQPRLANVSLSFARKAKT